MGPNTPDNKGAQFQEEIEQLFHQEEEEEEEGEEGERE